MNRWIRLPFGFHRHCAGRMPVAETSILTDSLEMQGAAQEPPTGNGSLQEGTRATMTRKKRPGGKGGVSEKTGAGTGPLL